MLLSETIINQAGLMRCCINTIDTLDQTIDYQNKHVIDCKHEEKDNKNIVLIDGMWQWNYHVPVLTRGLVHIVE